MRGRAVPSHTRGASCAVAHTLMRSEMAAGQSSGTLTSDRPPRTGAMPVTISHSITPKLYTSACMQREGELR